MVNRVTQKTFSKMFAQRLRAYRVLAGYDTAHGFAQQIEEEPNTYTRWERGETMPNIELLVRMCLALGITPNDLVWPKPKKTNLDELLTNEMLQTAARPRID
jgi:transcriptional regulator with XRE-family HTH domain